MEPTTALLLAGGIGAGGSVLGSLFGSDAAEDAAKIQQYGTNRASNAMLQANRFAQDQYQPYSNYGQYALPFAQSGLFGIQPEAMSKEDRAQLEMLQGKFDYSNLAGNTFGGVPNWLSDQLRAELGDAPSRQSVYDWLTQKTDMAGTNQTTRHWGEAYGPAQAQLARQMEQLQDLQRRQKIQSVYDQTIDPRTGQPTQGATQYIPTMERETGYLNALDALRGGKTDLTASPMYQAKQRELERTLNRKYAGRGGLYSSSADDAMLRNQGGLLEQEYGRQYGGLTDAYNMASGLSGRKYGQLLDALKVGAGAAGQAGQTSVATAGQVGSNYMAGANAAAQGTLNQGNIMSNMWSNLGALPMQGLALNNQFTANNALAKYYGG